MDDYIKRKDAIDAAAGWGDRGLPLAILEDIKTIPAADVVEVRHGRWILFSKKFGTVVCDKCHRQDHFDLLAKYCRYCGTRMDGGEA